MEITIFENGLITIYESDNGEKLVIGRELHEGIDSKSRYNDWIKNRVSDCDLIEGEDYIEINEVKDREIGATIMKEHYLKLDVAKEIAMLERNEMGKKYRRYFIEVEKKVKAESLTIEGLSPELKLLINMEKEQRRVKREIAAVKQSATEVREELQEMKDTIVISARENWRNETNRIIGKIGKVNNDYKGPREKIYKALEERGKCKLNVRLENLKGRALNEGMSRSAVEKLNILDVIGNDHKLKEIYVAIVKEYAIKYHV